MQKNETSHTIHKISQNVTRATIRLLEENIGSKQLDIILEIIFEFDTKSTDNKSKNIQGGIHQT